MKEKDMFALAVRILGLVFLYQGLSRIPEGIAQCVLLVLDSKTTSIGGASVDFAYRLSLGFWLVRGSPLLMHIAYPAEKSEQDRR